MLGDSVESRKEIVMLRRRTFDQPWLSLLLCVTASGVGFAGCTDDDANSGSDAGRDSSVERSQAGKGEAGGAGGQGGRADAGSCGAGGNGGAEAAGGRGGAAAAGGSGGTGGSSAVMTDAGMPPADEDAGVARSDITGPVAATRVRLDTGLAEHSALLIKATGAAVGARDLEVAAYRSLLDDNASALGEILRDAMGDQVHDSWAQLWSVHDQAMIDYAKGVATNDEPLKQSGETTLETRFIPNLTSMITQATGMSEEDTRKSLEVHVANFQAIIEAQAAGDWSKAYQDYDRTVGHMRALGDTVAQSLVRDASGVNDESLDFRVNLNLRMQQSAYLLTFASGAALGGAERADERMAAESALRDNGETIQELLDQQLDDTQTMTFAGLWSDRIDYFLDLTAAVGAADSDKKADAVEILKNTFAPAFARFMAQASGADRDALEAATTRQAELSIKAIDLQSESDFEDVANADKAAAEQMQKIADPISLSLYGAGMP